jgi:hypothetical protein
MYRSSTGSPDTFPASWAANGSALFRGVQPISARASSRHQLIASLFRGRNGDESSDMRDKALARLNRLRRAFRRNLGTRFGFIIGDRLEVVAAR